MARTPIIWFGGKQNLAQDIINIMPPHICYVEPFGGGASVITSKPPAKVDVYNDIDGDVVNFLMVVREDPEKLANAVRSLPYSRKLFEEWKWSVPHHDSFERAVRWFYLNRSSVVGGNNYKSGWRHSKETNPAKGLRNSCDLLEAFAERMRSVLIDCRDFREVIENYDSKDTLFYIDPPYRGRENFYKGKFNDKHHKELSDLLKTIQGKAIVSYYHDDLIDTLYECWNRIEIDTHTFAQPRKGDRGKATEVIFMNFEHSQMSIFDYVR